jgi:hypothetical protein
MLYKPDHRGQLKSEVGSVLSMKQVTVSNAKSADFAPALRVPKSCFPDNELKNKHKK